MAVSTALFEAMQGGSLFLVGGVFLAVTVLLLILVFFKRDAIRIPLHKIKKKVPGTSPDHQIQVTYYQRVGDNGWNLNTDVAARYTEGEHEYFDLLKLGKKIPAASYEYIGNTPNGQAHVTYLQHEDKEWQPVRPDFTNESIEHDDVAMREWHAADLERDVAYWHEDDEQWWHNSTIQAAMLFFGAGLFFLFIGFGYQKAFEGVAQSLAQNAEASKAAANQLANALKNTGG